MPQTVDLTEVTLAVLAGGRGSRMGVAKGELRLGNKPILQHLLERWRWPGPTMLVTAPGREHPPGWDMFDSESVDAVQEGPLGGVLTSIEHSRTADLVIATVDMPGMGRENLEWMIARLKDGPGRLGVMVLRTIAGKQLIEPFPLACITKAADLIRERLRSGDRSVHSLINSKELVAAAAPAEWADEVWINLNSPADFQAFSSRVGRK